MMLRPGNSVSAISTHGSGGVPGVGPRGLLPKTSQRGQATIEYLYVIPILLILLLGSLQFIFIYEAKLALNNATFVATRAGALNSGAMANIQDALYSGFAPFFVHGLNQQALEDARHTAKAEIGNNKMTLITIVNPPSSLAGTVIPNDNLMYRDPGDLSYGGLNVQDANLLKVRVTYCVRLVVPIVNRMISSFYVYALGGKQSPARIDSTYNGGSISAPELLTVTPPPATTGLCVDPSDPYPYRLPVTSEAVVRMQSPFQNTDGWTGPISLP